MNHTREHEPSDEVTIINSTAIQLNVTDCLARVSNYVAPHKCRSVFGTLCVFEASKLIVLIPPKTGHTLWKKILLDLNTSLPSKYHKLISHHLYQPYYKNTLDECKNFVTTFFCDISYRKIFVYRDPLTRLLSGYTDKCTTPYPDYTCTEYLLSVGIETKYVPHQPRFVHTNFSMFHNNTLNTFIKWLLFSYNDNNNALKFLMNYHFQNFYHFADLSYFHNNWNILNLVDMNTWDYIIKSILINSSLFKYWNDIRGKYFIDSGRKKITQHDTQSSSKVTLYYTHIDTLYLGLRYTWKDYYIFGWNLPEWICDILFLNNNSKAYIISDFIYQKFHNKTQLLPSCISLKNEII